MAIRQQSNQLSFRERGRAGKIAQAASGSRVGKTKTRNQTAMSGRILLSFVDFIASRFLSRA